MPKSVATTFEDSFKSHKGKSSDKWASYFSMYDLHFAKHRSAPISLLEIGVQNGGSLEIWGKYFPNALKLLGCDIDEKCGNLTFEDPRIKVIVGDASSQATFERITAEVPSVDIVIDDGSHVVSDVIRTFALYYPLLKPGGIYVVEDLHTSYWKDFGGGSDLDYTSMGFLKLLADLCNKESRLGGRPKTS